MFPPCVCRRCSVCVVGVRCSILWQLYKSTFIVYIYMICIFSSACTLYVRNVLKLTRGATSSRHVAHTPHVPPPACPLSRSLFLSPPACVFCLIKLIEFDCYLSCCLSGAGILANIVHFVLQPCCIFHGQQLQVEQTQRQRQRQRQLATRGVHLTWALSATAQRSFTCPATNTMK